MSVLDVIRSVYKALNQLWWVTAFLIGLSALVAVGQLAVIISIRSLRKELQAATIRRKG